MGVVTQGVKHSMNPFDEIALEEVCVEHAIDRILKKRTDPCSVAIVHA